MSITLRTLGVLAVLAALTACGQTPAERAATGALVGGAAAELADEDLTTGLLVGGAIGGIAPCVANPTASGCY